MKINDITQTQLSEQLYDWNDVVTGIGSFFKNALKPGKSWQDVMADVNRDRALKFAARGLIEWYKGIRYSISKAYDIDSERSKKQLQDALEKRVFGNPEAGALGANKTDVTNKAIDTIINAGDYLNSNTVIQAAHSLIANAVASKINRELGPSITPNKKSQIEIAADNIPYGDPGEYSNAPGTIIPVQIFFNFPPDRAEETWIKIKGLWYLDLAKDPSLVSVQVPAKPAKGSRLQTSFERAKAASLNKDDSQALETAVIVTGELNRYKLQSMAEHRLWLKKQAVEKGAEE